MANQTQKDQNNDDLLILSDDNESNFDFSFDDETPKDDELSWDSELISFGDDLVLDESEKKEDSNEDKNDDFSFESSEDFWLDLEEDTNSNTESLDDSNVENTTEDMIFMEESDNSLENTWNEVLEIKEEETSSKDSPLNFSLDESSNNESENLVENDDINQEKIPDDLATAVSFDLDSSSDSTDNSDLEPNNNSGINTWSILSMSEILSETIWKFQDRWNYIDNDIQTIEAKVTELQSQISDLESEVKREKEEISNLKKEKGSIVKNIASLEAMMSDQK